MTGKIEKFLIPNHDTVKEAMRRMVNHGEKVLFVVNPKKQLVGAVSDGDIRRWILSGKTLNAKVVIVCNRRAVTAAVNYDIEQIKKLMLDLRIEAIPLVNQRREILDILVWDKIFREPVKRIQASVNVPVVIMAGGKGTRLDPFTRILPKPLIPIGETPILEIIMEKFKTAGVKAFYLSINHKSKMIKAYFEEMTGRHPIHYIEETSPLGTAGSLGLIKRKIKGPFFVTNCDIIIDVDYNEILQFHNDARNDMTVVVSCKRYVIPYGVCEVQNGGVLKKVKEKPEYDLLVNTGMYVMGPGILRIIPPRTAMNMDDLIAKVKTRGLQVGVFPIDEKSWIDVGQWEEYQKAIKHFHEVSGS